MKLGLLQAWLRSSGARKYAAPANRSADSCCRLLLESLEIRALPSVLNVTLETVPLTDLAASGLTSDPTSTNPPGGSKSPNQQSGGEASPPVQSPGDAGNAPIVTGLTAAQSVPPTPLQVLPQPVSSSQVDHSQGQNNVGLGNDPQGDSGQGQTNNGANDDPGNLPSDGQDNTDNGQTGGQNTSGDNSNTSAAGDANSVPTPTDPSGSSPDGPNNSTAGQSTSADGSNNSAPAGSDSVTTPADSSGSSQDDPNNPITNSPSTGQSNNPASSVGNSQGNPSTTLPVGTKSNNDSALGLPPSASTGTGTSTGDGISSTTNGSGSTPDRRQHSPSSSPVFDGEPRPPLAGSDGKLRAPDTSVTTGEDAHSPATLVVQTVEQGSRYQAGIQSQVQSVTWEDSVPWPSERRGFSVESSPEAGIADSLPTPADEVLALANELHQGLVRGDAFMNLPPQNHGLLVKNPFGDLASLRSEVENFFSQIDNLGEQPVHKALGMMLSSGAVVVGAAMACEVARRQARRPGTGPTFAVPYAEAPSGIGLPHLGQFSARS